jgi:hypothetical protein
MATTLQLVWYETEITGGMTNLDTLDLFSGSDGITVMYNGLAQVVGARDVASVKQAMTLRVDASTYDELASIMQTLDVWQKRTAMSRSASDRNEVWILMLIGDETNAKQAQVLSLEYEAGDDLFNYAVPHLQELVLIIQRTPWEEVLVAGAVPQIAIDGLGGVAQLGTAIGGDLPARVVSMGIAPNDDLNEFWLGWRSEWFGDSSNFEPVWPLYAAAADSLDDDTAAASDATAYDGTSLATSFATEDGLIQRVLIQMQDVSTWLGTGGGDIEEDMNGRFGILLRARMGESDSEAHVRIGFGWADRTTYTLNHPVWRALAPITGTSYKLYDMQSVIFPPDKVNWVQSNLSIAVQARRIIPAGTLYLDCLGLVPLDEGAVHILCGADLDDTNIIRLVRTPAGKLNAFVQNYVSPNLEIVDVAKAEGENWAVPANGTQPRLVMFAQASAASALDATLNIDYILAQRYRYLRGAA